jgi:class 3 adenylate cyclase/pimeloyl-ACP methyl ester carboxylesterase/acyl dehydratase
VQHRLSYLERPDGVTIAHSSAGTGPPLVLIPGWTTHLEWFWQEPNTLLFEPLAHHVQLITYDKHGCGLSDRDRTDFSLDSELLDVEALVDRLGLEHFHLMGMSEGGQAAAAYAAKHPERVDKLVLYSTTANGTALGPPAFMDSFVNIIRSAWGMGSKAITDMIMPGASKEDQQAFATYQRQSASADVAANMMDALYHTDIRSQLASIQAETLIIHRRNSRAFPPRNGRDLAAGIPHSRAVIIDGVAHAPTPGDPNTIDVVNEILGFLVPGATATAVRDRATFHTVMFTDVEASTKLTDQFGDATARQLLRRHEEVCRSAIRSHGGREVKAMGDGFMVTFETASAALDAASDIQLGMTQEFADTEDPLRVRIGINAGEPIEEEDDLHGTAVIRSARIMGAADGGQILVSSIVRELVAGRDYAFISRGTKELKGFSDPVPVFELDWQHDMPASAAAAAAVGLESRIGVDPGSGAWFELTSETIEKFDEATGSETGDDTTSPFLVLSLLTHLIESIPDNAIPAAGLLAGINYGFEQVRFGPMVQAGSRLRATSVLKAAIVRGTAVQTTSRLTVEVKDRDEPALEADWVVRAVYRS